MVRLRYPSALLATLATASLALAALPLLGGDPNVSCLPCIEAHENFLAGDALRGRGSGTRDEWLAASYIASRLQEYGVEPAAPGGGYLEFAPTSSRLPAATSGPEPGAGSPEQEMPQPSPQLGFTTNVIGVLQGTDADAPVLLLTAHLDHLGVDPRRAVHGDAIFNGADDDASGCTAVLELARMLAEGKRPQRTVYFAFFGSEETGGAGARYFLQHPPVPLSRIFANLEFEMIGWPDPKVPPHTLWLTGWPRSNLGPELARMGARVVADVRPEQHFFCRSDNIQLAEAGVVAQTVSSFGMQPMYHQPDDDVAHLDFKLMEVSITSLIQPIRSLLNSDFKPAWNPGGQPQPEHPCAYPATTDHAKSSSSPAR